MKDLRLESVLFYTIEKSIKVYRQFAQDQLRKHNIPLTVDQWLTLKALHEDPDMTQNQLAEKVFKDSASITRILRLLAQKGMLSKVPSRQDRRKSKLTISKKGEQLIARSSLVVSGYRKHALRGIPVKNTRNCSRVLESIIRNCINNEKK